jgi:alanine racemase
MERAKQQSLVNSFLKEVPLSSTSAMIVDLQAIQHNYRLTQQHLKDGCEIAAVVKADSYGLGMVQTAQALYAQGCRVFCVAFIEEGLRLRQALPYQDAKIIIFCGVLARTEGLFAEANLIPVIVDREQVKRWSDFARLKSQALPAVLHVDTGMTRNGLSFQEIMRISQNPSSMSSLKIEMIISHLASSDNLEVPQNEEQRQTFERCLKMLPKAAACLANSNGISLGEAYHYDYVRPGLGLYGYANPYPDAHQLQPSLAVYARIVQVQDVHPGQTVGYNATYHCTTPKRLATLGIGYADGIMRELSNKGHVYIGGFAAPIIGRISMDFTMVDVTDVPESLSHIDAWASLYPTAQNLREMAYLAGTNPYELLTSLGKRSHRIYLQAIDKNETTSIESLEALA